MPKKRPAQRSARPGASGQAAAPASVITPSQKQTLKSMLTQWLQCVRDWYPDLQTTFYFFPPFRFNRVPYEVVIRDGQPVLVPQPLQAPKVLYHAQPIQVPPPSVPAAGSVWPQPPLTPIAIAPVQDSDLQDDAALEYFLHCLRVLANKRKEVMMVISELDFKKYLDHETDPINAAVFGLLPRPSDLARQYRRGDFDVLIIHRLYGLIVAEVKSVRADLQKMSDLDKVVVKRVQKAIDQLNKAQYVLCHLVSDMPKSVNITKTLILPNITSDQLRQALGTDATVSQALCQCLNTQNPSAAIRRCLCADQMPTTEDLHFQDSTAHLSNWARVRQFVLRHVRRQRQGSTSSSTGMKQLSAWWQNAVLDAGHDLNMTTNRYEELMARFCGPATTVEIPTVTAPRKVVRTRAQAVAETGLIMSSLALYPEQVDLLDRNLDSVFLWAAPGCGKTVLLVLKAIQWRRQEKDVYLVSVCSEGRTVSILSEHQINHSLGTAPPAGTLHRYHFDLKASPGEVADAVTTLAGLSRDTRLYVIIDEVELGVMKRFKEFCNQLHDSVSALSLWAAGVWGPLPLPSWMPMETLSAPLRCPPSVHRAVGQSGFIDDTFVPRYLSAPSPAATDGPAIVWLEHKDQTDHSGGDPQDCEQCGQNIARRLRNELRVGEAGHDSLQWRDAVILFNNPSDGSATVRALRASGVPVEVVGRGAQESDVREMALAVRNVVVMTERDTVSGLERRVVVGAGEMGKDKLVAMSRSTSQLVWIDRPDDM